MARLLVGSRWYDGLASESLLESEFERLVEQSAPRLFPGWIVVPFRCDIESEFGRKRADLALIDRVYREWWVVEVEMAHHSLEAHVLPQVDVFRSGRYGPEHVAHLLGRRSDFEPEALASMLRGALPGVLVVVNLPCPHWVRPLRERDAFLSVVEIFRSDLDEHAIRLNGDQPRPPGDLITRCHRVEYLRRLLVVDSPAALGGRHADRFVIEFAGLEATWVRCDLADRVCLSPLRGDPLSGIRTIDVVRLPDGRLAFDHPRRS